MRLNTLVTLVDNTTQPVNNWVVHWDFNENGNPVTYYSLSGGDGAQVYTGSFSWFYTVAGHKAIRLKADNNGTPSEDYWGGLNVVDCNQSIYVNDFFNLFAATIDDQPNSLSLFSGSFNLPNINNVLSSNSKPVIFSACNEITLRDGFEALSGEDFTAEINQCLQEDASKTIAAPLISENTTNNITDTTFSKTITHQETKSQTIKEDEKNVNNQFDLNIYPNPSSGYFDVLVSGTNGKNYNIELLDVFGKKYYSNLESESIIGFDISEFSKGIYVIKITYENKILSKNIIHQ